MASVLIVAGGTGRAASRASVLAIAIVRPRTVFEAMVGIGVARVAAKTARCSTAMLRVRIVFPTSVFQGMALRGAGADVGIADAAIFFDCMLRFIILIVFRAGTVTAILIFAAATAIVASAIPAML